MITYDQLVEIALLQTGQYILNIDELEIDRPKLELIIKRELQWFSLYIPVKKTGDFILYNDKEFTVEKDGVIPLNITNIRRKQNVSYPIFSHSRGRYVANLRWRYYRPVLEFIFPKDVYKVDYFMPHEYKDGIIETLDSNSPFVELFIARFMISLGRGRSAFVLNDIPITTNADELLSAGNELLSNIKEFIQETSSYHLAIRI